MSRRLALVILVSVIGGLSALPTAQQPPGARADGPAIRLRAATFVPSRGEQPASADQFAGLATLEARREYLLQFTGPVQESWKTAVVSAGATLFEYVPDFAFRVRLDAERAAAIRQLPFVAWLGPYHSAYKIVGVRADRGDLPLLVTLDRDAVVNTVESALAASGLPVTRVGRTLLMVRARPDAIAALARVAGVSSIEPFVLRVKHNEHGGGTILGSRVANTLGFDGSSQVVAVADTGLGDGTAAGAHADLPASRIVAVRNWPGLPNTCFETIANDGAADVDTGHGTHVATAVLGGGNALGVGRGTAPGAGLVFQAIENYAIPSLLCSILYGVPDGYYLVGLPGDLGDLYEQAYLDGARIHSDSWGSAVNGAYTADAENTDAFVWARRDMTLLFSAGNQGVDVDGDGQVDPGSIGSPASAKNVIAVGASENDRRGDWSCDPGLAYTPCAAQGGQNVLSTYGATWPSSYPANPLRDDPPAGNAEQMAAFSSRGPTSDGRIKPDVVAPGTWTLSGYSTLYQQQYDPSPNPQNGAYQYDGWGIPADASYKYMGGTSMATPLVAGGAAVVRDFYQKVHGHAATAALVKATLINSAVDLLDENNDGALDNAYPIPNAHEGWGRIDLAGATDNTQQFSDEVAPLTTGATATYTFDVADPGRPFKATLVWTDYPGAPTAAVSLVNDLDLQVIGPGGETWLGNVFSGGWSAAGGAPDRRNNVENVFVPAAAPGTWTVIVTAYNVPMGPQPFALVMDNGPVDSGLPVVRLSVDDASATEAGPTTATVRLTRSGDTSSALTVHYTVGGTAVAGSDYVALPGSAVIPEGAAEVLIAIEPIDDPQVEPAETVSITVVDDAAYRTGSPSSGATTITSDDQPPDLGLTSVVSPSTAAAGTMLTITVTTKNYGTAPAPSSETGVYLSSNSLLDASDVFVGSRAIGPLAAGASESGPADLQIPDDFPAGTYYLVGKADYVNAVPETYENNNVRASAPVRIGPDLTLTALTVPATGAPGGTITIGDTTRNQGAADALASVTGLYLSTNTSWDASDTRLGGRAVPALAGGASSAGSAVVTLPVTVASGTYYIVARADDEGAIGESTETNNLRTATIRIGADLTVTALTAPAAAGAGDTITVTDTTRNAGAAETPETETVFYLSANASFDGADLALGSRLVPALGAGASHQGSADLTLPGDVVAGTYYVVAHADGTNAVAETSETNNVRASSVVRVGPDLTVTSVSAPSTAEAGAAITITETVKNQGGASSAATESAFYLSVNSTFDTGDVELGRRAVPSLAPSVSSTVAASVNLPMGLATGNYYVIVVADPDGVVSESTETNNSRVSSVVKVGPDLIVTSLTGPASVVRGAAVALTDNARNQGGGSAPASTTRFYLSLNAALDGSDVLLGERTVPTLGAGASHQAVTSLVIPVGTTPATYYVIASADGPGLVAETAENNNTRTKVLRIDP